MHEPTPALKSYQNMMTEFMRRYVISKGDWNFFFRHSLFYYDDDYRAKLGFDYCYYVYLFIHSYYFGLSQMTKRVQGNIYEE